MAPSSLPTLPGPSQRKQNLACDSCRRRKVRCLRTDKTQICQQCNNKGEECTNNYIDSLAQSKTKKSRKSSNEDVSSTAKKRIKGNQPDESQSQISKDDTHVMNIQEDGAGRRDSTHSTLSKYEIGETSRQGSLSMMRNNSMESLHIPSQLSSVQAIPSSLPEQPPFNLFPIKLYSTEMPLPVTSEASQQAMLRYLFSPAAITTSEHGYDDLSSISLCREGQSDLWEEQDGKVWYEEPSDAHKSLNEESMKDLIDDLIETFFSIVQPRYTMLDSTIFKARYASPSTHPLGAISHTFLAIVLTYGARFSDHPIIQSDREECSSRDGDSLKARQRSRLVGLMVIRARAIAEHSRIYRIPSLENANSCLFLEHLLGRYQATWISAGVKHIFSMGLNSSLEWSKIQDPQVRHESLNIVWITRMSESSRAALYRLQPSLSTQDFDIDPVQHAMLSEGAPIIVPLGGTEHNIVDQATWFQIHRTICSITYTLAKSLWVPSVTAHGIPFKVLRDFIHSSSIWRDKYLSSIGIPTIWPDNWDFLQAINTCTCDCYYHDLWLIVHKAIQDFGIKEEKSNDINGISRDRFEIDNIKRRIKEEAEHAALRIAALTGVLTENGYLKLDPLIINHPIYAAGEYLAALGRSEYLICVAGLRQYAIIYPSLWDQADKLDSIYQEATKTDLLNGLTSLPSSLLTDGVGIPPRLDLMDSFESWTGSIWGNNSQVNPSNDSSRENANVVSDDNVKIAHMNGNGNVNGNETQVDKSINDDTFLRGELPNGIEGEDRMRGKESVNFGHWMGW
ncbi:hypothetical protein V865_008054 [Kwoniella europaea PYCC6329]|uniref:Zn(2)-C6 fungal-type domain-containing protein n=1 Tax=Kwoniella europaea PYCC6329 TaxID=1423913 RepID=A0AAX4KVI4_9TREE